MSGSSGFVVWLVAAALAAWNACVAASLQQEEFVFAALLQQGELCACCFLVGAFAGCFAATESCSLLGSV